MKPAASVDVEFLNSLMKVKGLNESEFAQTIGVSRSTLSRVINGKRGAGNKFIFGILVTFPDVAYGQLIKPAHALPKGNKMDKVSVSTTGGTMHEKTTQPGTQ